MRDFQARNGLEVDGIVGPITARALGLGGVSTKSTGGGSGTAALQARLGIPADGEYGPQTRAGGAGLPGPQRAGGGRRGRARRRWAPWVSPGRRSAPAAVASGGGGGGSAVAAVQSKLGAPYALGGEGPSWDCSGLTQWAMAQRGITIPRTSYDQFNVGTPVSRGAIQAGDLVFWDTDGTGASHVGVATSNSSVISATTRGVREHAIDGEYWGERYRGARRF